MNNSIVLIWK